MYVLVNDVKLFFDVEGAKLRPDGAVMREVPTLLLQHGGPGFDHSGFKPAFTEMAACAQVIYLDLRGHGRSDAGPTNKWSLEQCALDVRSFCDSLSIDAPIVLGHSFGGIVAIVYATRFVDHPSKLVLSSTSTQPSANDLSKYLSGWAVRRHALLLRPSGCFRTIHRRRPIKSCAFRSTRAPHRPSATTNV
jgi:pimeloyl-ACP methyl ester carboxylesterase